ncbi:hypothetical protein [Salinicola sp. CPA57]|uniref:hypothetical protein n=1 Tax=Salinicola sp. CPA57 TaxID=1949080 RepID=UPI000DA22E5E|nr:hypothetical protein [Salinicola sp. CPA57]
MKTTDALAESLGVPESLIARLKATDRVVLVASNPNITRRHIRQAQITPRSLVFSFNKCRQLHKLPFDTSHYLVHRYGVRDKHYFGYPHKLRVRLFERFARDTTTLLLDGQAEPADGKHVYGIPMLGKLSLLENYPFDTLPERGGASTGFYMIALLAELKTALGLDFSMTLIGFTDGGGGRQWYGHAWAFERQMTARLNPEMIEVFPKKQT